MSYNKYIKSSLKGVVMGSLVVSLFSQMDEKVAKAESNDFVETLTYHEGTQAKQVAAVNTKVKAPLKNANKSSNTKNPNQAPPKYEHTKYDYSNLHGRFDTSKKFTYNGIKVSYKNHTYNVKSQKEYDEVMNFVNKMLAGKTLTDVLKTKVEYYNLDLEYDLQVLEKYMNGEIEIIRDRNNPATRTKENSTAIGYSSEYKELLDNGISFETLSKYIAASDYVEHFMTESYSLAGPPNSAHDYFIKKDVDCDATAYAQQVLWDTLGYNTAVVTSPALKHGFLIIELDGVWYADDFYGVYKSGVAVFDKVRKGDSVSYAPWNPESLSELMKINGVPSSSYKKYIINGKEYTYEEAKDAGILDLWGGN